MFQLSILMPHIALIVLLFNQLVLKAIEPSRVAPTSTLVARPISTTPIFFDSTTNYKVKGSVRSINNPTKTAHLITLPHAAERLELVEADLTTPAARLRPFNYPCS